MGCKIMLFHGGEFQRVSHLVYNEGESCEVDCDPDYLSIGDIMEMVEKMSYPQDKITKLLYAKPRYVMEDATKLDMLWRWLRRWVIHKIKLHHGSFFNISMFMLQNWIKYMLKYVNDQQGRRNQQAQPQPPLEPLIPQPQAPPRRLPPPPPQSSPYTIQPPPSPETQPPPPSPPPTQLTQTETQPPPPSQPETKRPHKLQAIGGKGNFLKKKPRMTTTPSGTKIILPVNCNPPSRKEAARQAFGPSTAPAASLGHVNARSSKFSVKAAPKMKSRTTSAMSWFTCSSNYSTAASVASSTAPTTAKSDNVAANGGRSFE